MPIRAMTTADLPRVSQICMQAFMTSVAGTLSQQGIDTFSQIAASESFRTRLENDNTMLVYVDGDDVLGVVELKAGRHLAMLFVDPLHQGRGIGRQLVATILRQAETEQVTVSASMSSVLAYLRYGFQCCGEVAESAGLVYQPMQIAPAADPEHTSIAAAG